MNKRRSFLQLRFVSLNCFISEVGSFVPRVLNSGINLSQWAQFGEDTGDVSPHLFLFRFVFGEVSKIKVMFARFV